MIFSQKECDLLVKCLNAYLADDEAHTEFGGTVITSALNKLNNINAMTMFTRKEFSAMCTSMYYIEEVYDFGNLETLPGFSSSLPGGFYHLMQKTNRLCDAL